MEEDSQALEEPIIAPVKVKKFATLEESIPKTTYSAEFMVGLMGTPELIRNVVLLGHLHHRSAIRNIGGGEGRAQVACGWPCT